MKDPAINARVETNIKIEAEDSMSEDWFDAKLSHSYAQSAAGEGRPMNDVFDDLERSLK